VVVRDLTETPSNWRADRSLDDLLRHHRVPAISGVDTRRLTRHLRGHGALPGAFGADEAGVRAAAASARPTDGLDLVARVTTAEPYAVGDADARFSVVAYDFGIKRTILRNLVASGCRVEVVPASTPAAAVLGRRPDGVFLSNGPGDPAAVAGAADTVRALVGEVPVFGICLGHQILGLALGARTVKLAFGHHGANHPVRHLSTGRVEITSQNHNYAVDADSVGAAAGAIEITHVNLNDGVVEGFRLRDAPAFGVQHHPEAGPGPHDARYLFDDFTALMTRAGSR
jgi:carbamoyl-phosphate synthase small subunit